MKQTVKVTKIESRFHYPKMTIASTGEAVERLAVTFSPTGNEKSGAILMSPFTMEFEDKKLWSEFTVGQFYSFELA